MSYIPKIPHFKLILLLFLLQTLTRVCGAASIAERATPNATSTQVTATSANAQNTTQVGWVSEPDGRGTLGLLWGCLSTLFVCTWTAVHLNVSHLGSEWSFWKVKIVYMLVAIVMPEVLVVFAAQSFFMARSDVKSHFGWDLTKAFYASSGGFRIRNKAGRTYVVIGEALDIIQKQYGVKLPDITSEEIESWSKADGVAKAIALLQIIWLFTQTIARFIQDLPVTTLELFTVTNVLCAIFMYGFWWKKPQDLRTGCIIETDRADLEIWLIQRADSNSHARDVYEKWMLQLYDRKTGPKHIRNGIFVGAAMLCVTSSIHFLTLANPVSTFPSRAEWILWIVLSSILGAFSAIYWFLSGLEFLSDKLMEFLPGPLIVEVLLYSSYSILRFILFVEAFVALRSLPASAYDDIDWNNFLPHI